MTGFREQIGTFNLLKAAEGRHFSGINEASGVESVRVIEDGPVRTVVEAVFGYANSFACQRYKLPKRGTEIEVELVILWNEKSQMLKLAVPTVFTEGNQPTTYLGQVAYGVEELATDGRETVSQQWVGVFAQAAGRAFSCINDGIYGSDFKDGEIRLSLLRSAGYAGHPILERTIMPQDRYSSRIDQGERHFRFWFKGGDFEERLGNVGREALVHNEKPVALSFFPAGTLRKPQAMVELSDPSVLLATFKAAERGQEEAYVIRMFEPTGQTRATKLFIPYLNLEREIKLGPYELKSLRLDVKNRELLEVDLLEEEVVR